MDIVFTDLDGTLLDPGNYSFTPAEPALQRLAEARIPLVFSTSKTRAETELWRQRLNNTHPFIVENGGAIFLPPGYFPFPGPGAWRCGYAVMEFGDPYADLVTALAEASAESGCPVEGFHDWSAEQIACVCALPLDDAVRAREREYDEPFQILTSDRAAIARLLAAIEARGKRWTRGGRFYHITGAQDKAEAAHALAGLYRRAFGAVRTIGLGDGPNDIGLLNAVDVPFIIRSAHAAAVAAQVPNGRITRLPGPEGWNEALLGLLGRGAESA